MRYARLDNEKTVQCTTINYTIIIIYPISSVSALTEEDDDRMKQR